MGDAVVVLVVAVLVAARTGARGTGQIGFPLLRHALHHESRRHLVVGGQHQGRVKLLGLEHVEGERLRQALELVALHPLQRHHPLVGLLARLALFGVERDGTAPGAARIHHLGQARLRRHLALHRRSGAQAQVGLHLGHRQLDRPIAMHLHDQGAVELDVGLHQHPSGQHLAQKLAHGRRVSAGFAVAGAPALDLGPGVGQTHDGTAHGHAIEQKLVQFRHPIPHQSSLRNPARKRRALST